MFTVNCNACTRENHDLLVQWPTREQAQDAAVWHVYESHPAVWLHAIGDRAPNHPDPRKVA